MFTGVAGEFLIQGPPEMFAAAPCLFPPECRVKQPTALGHSKRGQAVPHGPAFPSRRHALDPHGPETGERAVAAMGPTWAVALGVMR